MSEKFLAKPSHGTKISTQQREVYMVDRVALQVSSKAAAYARKDVDNDTSELL